MAVLNVTGTWWLPENPERQVHGSLTFDLKEGGRLALDGILRRPEDLAIAEPLPGGGTQIAITEDILEAAGDYGRIHGKCDGRAFTLDGCFQIRSRTNLIRHVGNELIHVGQIFDGVWFSANEQAGGNKLEFGVLNLANWVSRSGIEESIRVENEVPVGHTIKGETMSPLVASVPTGGTVALNHSISVGRIDSGVSIKNVFRVEVDLDGFKTIEDLTDAASDLQDLVSIGTGDIAQFTSVHVWHSDLAARGGRTHEGGFDFYAPWSAVAPNDRKPVKPHEFYFTVEDLGGVDFLPGWMSVAARHRSTLGRVMSTRYASGMQLADRFINRAAALEGFDRVESGMAQGRIFAARIEACFELAGKPFEAIVEDSARWIQEFKHHRNELAHHYGRRMRYSGVEQHYLAESAYWLFVFCMLRTAGADDAGLEKIAQNQKIRHLGRMVRRHF